ncbi:hypothetical protein EV195_10593 [Tenacibaculum skagerrakense]|uniref:Uncharacterized protein n=1 Tax=Tenacibaculum skagerrakense TaxID=186571 RepID=A0A4R2NSC0_9FLAO|nr:hypothetical protein [Tenacibaculum skagerrakense]TCP24662.1 hypothetical protein EV195_10593 [Tenacibaculum skagerrakense]
MGLLNININFIKLFSVFFLFIMFSCKEKNETEDQADEIKIKEKLKTVKTKEKDFFLQIEDSIKKRVKNIRLIDIFNHKKQSFKRNKGGALSYFEDKFKLDINKNILSSREAVFLFEDNNKVYIREFLFFEEKKLLKLKLEFDEKFDDFGPIIKAPYFSFSRNKTLYIVYVEAEFNREKLSFFRFLL